MVVLRRLLLVACAAGALYLAYSHLRVRHHCRNLWSNDPLAREVAIAWLVNNRPDLAARQFEELARGGERSEAVSSGTFGLALLGRPRGIPVLVRLLDSPSALTRMWTLRMLGASGDERLCDVVRPYLEDADAFVRCRAAGALLNLNSTEAVPVLIGMLKDKDPEVRDEASAILLVAYLSDSSGLPVGYELESDEQAEEASKAYMAWWRERGIHLTHKRNSFPWTE